MSTEKTIKEPFNNAQENSGILTSSNAGREVVLAGRLQLSSGYPHVCMWGYIWWAPVRDAKHPVICGYRTAPYTLKCTKEKFLEFPNSWQCPLLSTYSLGPLRKSSTSGKAKHKMVTQLKNGRGWDVRDNITLRVMRDLFVSLLKQLCPTEIYEPHALLKNFLVATL